jgi:hypothetical protein
MKAFEYDWATGVEMSYCRHSLVVIHHDRSSADELVYKSVGGELAQKLARNNSTVYVTEFEIEPCIVQKKYKSKNLVASQGIKNEAAPEKEITRLGDMSFAVGMTDWEALSMCLAGRVRDLVWEIRTNTGIFDRKSHRLLLVLEHLTDVLRWMKELGKLSPASQFFLTETVSLWESHTFSFLRKRRIRNLMRELYNPSQN